MSRKSVYLYSARCVLCITSCQPWTPHQETINELCLLFRPLQLTHDPKIIHTKDNKNKASNNLASFASEPPTDIEPGSRKQRRDKACAELIPVHSVAFLLIVYLVVSWLI